MSLCLRGAYRYLAAAICLCLHALAAFSADDDPAARALVPGITHDALAAADQLPKASQRVRTYRRIMEVQVKAGDYAGARETAERISHLRSRGEALLDIIRRQAEAGDIAGAAQRAGRIESAEFQARAHLTVAQVQVRIGHRKDARRRLLAARRIAEAVPISEGEWHEGGVDYIPPYRYPRDSVLHDIAVTLADCGDLADASSTMAVMTASLPLGAGRSGVNEYREDIRREIDYRNASLGGRGRLRAFAQRELDSYEKTGEIVRFAYVQAQRGDVAGAKRLLIAAGEAVMRLPAPDDVETRWSALALVARMQHRLGDTREALRTIRPLEENELSYLGILWRREAASELLRSGNAREAEKLLAPVKQALDTAADNVASLPESHIFVTVCELRRLAVVQAETGDLAGAHISLEKADRALRENADRPGRTIRLERTIDLDGILTVGIEPAELGPVSDFRDTSADLKSLPEYIQAPTAVALAEVRQGDLRAALRTAGAIQEGLGRVEAITRIAVAYSEAGERDAAKRLLRHARWTALEAYGRAVSADALAIIALAQARTRDWKGAGQTVNEISDAEIRARTLYDIGAVQAKAGALAEARRSLIAARQAWSTINGNKGTISLLFDIAIGQAECGDAREAVSTSSLVADPSLKVAILTRIAAIALNEAHR